MIMCLACFYDEIKNHSVEGSHVIQYGCEN